MPKLTYDSSRGLIQETGSGIAFNADAITFSTLPTSAVQTVTSTSAVTSGGVYALTASQGVLTVSVPPPSDLPGVTLVFRSASPSAHVITGSTTAGPNIFAGRAGLSPANSGQRITFPATTGTSVSLISDGLSYCILTSSGTMTITNP